MADFLEPLFTAAEMRAAEEAYPDYPNSVPELMDRAGKAVAEAVDNRFPDARRIAIVAGSGSNGGDGRVAAGLLQANREVRVVDVKPEDEPKDLGDPDVVIDAIFGTGFTGEPRPGAARLIQQVNRLGKPVVAVDVPSGVDASTGEIAGAAIDADVTVTFHGPKVRLHVAPGRFRAGDVVADIGLEGRKTAAALVCEQILRLIPAKREGDNKYTAGAVLVVGGSRGLTGAACLAARAAFRADAGYVAVAAPVSSLTVLEQQLVEVVKRPVAEDWQGRMTEEAAGSVVEAAERMRAVALGPGLGRSDSTVELVRRVMTAL